MLVHCFVLDSYVCLCSCSLSYDVSINHFGMNFELHVISILGAEVFARQPWIGGAGHPCVFDTRSKCGVVRGERDYAVGVKAYRGCGTGVFYCEVMYIYIQSRSRATVIRSLTNSKHFRIGATYGMSKKCIAQVCQDVKYMSTHVYRIIVHQNSPPYLLQLAGLEPDVLSDS